MSCPDCDTKLIGKLTYPHEGKSYMSYLCPRCHTDHPPLKGNWAKPGVLGKDAETPAERRERLISGRWRGVY